MTSNSHYTRKRDVSSDDGTVHLHFHPPRKPTRSELAFQAFAADCAEHDAFFPLSDLIAFFGMLQDADALMMARAA